MKIGVMIPSMENIEHRIRFIAQHGFYHCQVSCYDASFYTKENAEKLRSILAETGVSVSTFWAGWSGPKVWNSTEGPVTLGLLPPAYRYKRIQELKMASDFAKWVGIKQIATHVGFIPENPHDPQFEGLMNAIREVASHVRDNGQLFLFETGQETPIALLRAITVVDLDNLGINFDTANSILYGKANPVDLVHILGKYVRDVHIKDGKWPTDGWNLGPETPMGEGCVDFPAVIQHLQGLSYEGTWIIERELEENTPIQEILAIREKLRALL